MTPKARGSPFKCLPLAQGGRVNYCLPIGIMASDMAGETVEARYLAGIGGHEEGLMRK
jgi:hypothetical protein